MTAGAATCLVCHSTDTGCVPEHDGEIVCYGPATFVEGFDLIRRNDAGGHLYRRIADSIPAPIESDRAGMEFPEHWRPTVLSELAGDGTVPWIWDGFVAEGSSRLLVGLYKAGKTTLLSHLLRASGTGSTS